MADLSSFAPVLEQYMQSKRIETPQERYEAAYIGVSEIMDITKLSRPSVITKMNNRFPGVKVGNCYIWERSPELLHVVNSWVNHAL